MELAAGKHVLLGVTGGIAVYKALDVIGRLQDEKVETRVVMTRAAENLVSPITFQARSGYPVFTDMWTPAPAGVPGSEFRVPSSEFRVPGCEDSDQDSERKGAIAGGMTSNKIIEHIEYARWADLMLVAPLTAHTAAKFALGLADDALSTLYLAYDGPVIVAPAMNTVMWQHPATMANFKTLKERGVEIIEPDEGRLACGEIGAGKMASVERIVEAALLALTRSGELQGRRVLITAGPTREYLDPVRYLSNRSSGKMGYAMAGEALRRSAEVTLVSGPVDLPAPAGISLKRVVSAREMHEAVALEIDTADIVIFCAAVADFAPQQTASAKLKKTGKPLTLKLMPAPDIAFETSRRRRPGQLRVGFAAETDNLEKNAIQKMEKKRLDFIAANDVSDSRFGFESDHNRVTLLGAGGLRIAFEIMTKRMLARSLFDEFVKAWRMKAAKSKS
ncbi:MAG: bifunctional phosphopantothenoylcysteine decarboxylase/phosphopantothenate--cysteine ligase CoaBC [Candidatus Sumerlaeota bacterium]|nr:bifunctional phosphopantothenoylcysteine decarboxylase/phosphopantothenate--cysteine ligase CoaBC [Candidatus Sumerlaeota bacterium]